MYVMMVSSILGDPPFGYFENRRCTNRPLLQKLAGDRDAQTVNGRVMARHRIDDVLDQEALVLMFSFEKLKSFNSPAENLGSLGQDAGLANQGAQLAALAGFPCQLHQFEARQEPSAFCDSDVEDVSRLRGEKESRILQAAQ